MLSRTAKEARLAQLEIDVEAAKAHVYRLAGAILILKEDLGTPDEPVVGPITVVEGEPSKD